MSEKRFVLHVVPDKGAWLVETEQGWRGRKVRRHFDIKEMAEGYAHGRAEARWADKHQHAQVKTHNADGTISDEHTYGGDPERSPG